MWTASDPDELSNSSSPLCGALSRIGFDATRVYALSLFSSSFFFARLLLLLLCALAIALAVAFAIMDCDVPVRVVAAVAPGMVGYTQTFVVCVASIQDGIVNTEVRWGWRCFGRWIPSLCRLPWPLALVEDERGRLFAPCLVVFLLSFLFSLQGSF